MIAILRVIILTASVLAGECDPIRAGCPIAVARTMANRVADGQTNVLAAYYGRGRITTEAAMAATLLVLRPGVLADGRYYYVWSNDDRRRLGWPAGEKVLCGAGLCVNFGREWPGS